MISETKLPKMARIPVTLKRRKIVLMAMVRVTRSPVEYCRRNEGWSLSKRSQTAACVTEFIAVEMRVVTTASSRSNRDLPSAATSKPSPI